MAQEVIKHLQEHPLMYIERPFWDELDFGRLDDEGPECYLLEAESRKKMDREFRLVFTLLKLTHH